MLPPSSLRANPNNGVLHAGHHNGVVTMWSPAMGSPLVRMLAHPAPITSLAVDRSGHYMVTAAMDKQVWRGLLYACLCLIAPNLSGSRLPACPCTRGM